MAAQDQITQEFPTVFSWPLFFSFLAVFFFFFQCLPKMLIFVEISNKNSSAVWNRNVVSKVKGRMEGIL